MSSPARDVVSRYDVEPDAVFVFPSEAAAAFWRKEALRTTGRASIDPGRILGWESFKERLLAGPRGSKPVGHARRTLFAASILRENGRSPFLSVLIDSRFADSSLSFLRPLRKLLPYLREIVRRNETLSGDGRSPERMARLMDECRLLSRRYDAFLARNGLYEPVLSDSGGGGDDGEHRPMRCYVVYPEVIEDFPEYRAALERTAEIVPVAVPAARDVPMLRFPNVIAEMRAVLRRVEGLLDEGVEPDRIMISAADLEDWAEHLEAEAALREIPLDLRRSRPLFRFSGGRLFALLAELADTDFSLSAMKAFLLNRGIPIRRRKDARELIRLGIEGHCIRNYRSAGAYRDLWERALLRKEAALLRRAAEEDAPDAVRRMADRAGELLRFYRRLRRSIRRIARASTFRALREALDDFCGRFLALNRWDGMNLSVFYRGLEVLEEFARAEPAMDGEMPGRPFRIWMGALGEEYCAVPSRGDGVPVYGYRVSAGIEPDYHFVVGASQESTRSVASVVSLLGDEAKERLGFDDRDFSETLLSLYSRSGDAVAFSFSGEGYSGPGLPPGFFVSRALVQDAGQEECSAESDPYLRERMFWSGRGSAFPERIYPVQRSGFFHMLKTGFSGKRTDFVRHSVQAGDILEKCLRTISDERGFLSLSWTHLEEFFACPFSFFFRRLLGVPDGREEDLYLSDPRSFGTLAHQVLEELFAEIGRRHGRFRRDAVESYRDLLTEIGDAVLTRWANERSSPIEPVLNAGGPGIMEILASLPEVEADAFPDHLVEGVESWYGVDLPEDRIRLYGKIDRVSLHPESGKAVLIDYKMNTIPSRKAVTGEEEGRSSFQIPFYVFLVRSSGLDVGAACYYRIRRGEYVRVFFDGQPVAGKGRASAPWMDGEGLSRCIDGMLRKVRDSAERMRTGAFAASSTGRGCEGCTLRAVCRVKYVVR